MSSTGQSSPSSSSTNVRYAPVTFHVVSNADASASSSKPSNGGGATTIRGASTMANNVPKANHRSRRLVGNHNAKSGPLGNAVADLMDRPESPASCVSVLGMNAHASLLMDEATDEPNLADDVHDDDQGDSSSEESDPKCREQLAKHDFMVGFLVDARGGSMMGCRFSGVKVIIPPRTVSQPTHITCRYVRQENLLFPPPLNEGEGLAARILRVGPVGTRFLGPVLIEVPHFVSLQSAQRELRILRCNSAIKGVWHEHDQPTGEILLKDPMFNSLSPSSSLNSSLTRGSYYALDAPQHQHHLQRPPNQHTVKIVTENFPQYFAIISRCRQQLERVGPEGCVLQSPHFPRARIIIPQKALTRDIEIGVSVQQVDQELLADFVLQGGAVTPILSLEPRRRKFHRAITVVMPLPNRMAQNVDTVESRRAKALALQAKMSTNYLSEQVVSPLIKLGLPPDNMGPDVSDPSSIETSLRLLCSMSGNYHKAYWEDVTHSTPLTFHSGCVQFNSIVSASFWLIDCPNWMCNDLPSLVDQLYKNTTRVPYLARFHLYAKRSSLKAADREEFQVRLLCINEAARNPEHSLEEQEDYGEICRSDYVELFDRCEICLEFGGNLKKTKECERRTMRFRPFFENRESYTLRRRNDKNPFPKGKCSIVMGWDQVLFETKVDVTRFLVNKPQEQNHS